MSFSRLPDVLVQLLAQSLPLAEILALARCNRATLAAIDSPVAFLFAPLTIVFPIPAAKPLNSRLLRHVLLRLQWQPNPAKRGIRHHSRGSVNALLDFARLRATQAGGFVRGLDAASVSHWLGDSHWNRILGDPAMSRLRFIRSHGYSDDMEDQVAAPVALLHLECLEIRSFRGTGALLRLIPHAPNLTSLRLLDGGVVTPVSSAEADDFGADNPDPISCDSLHYAGSLSLTHLDLFDVCLFGSLFKRMFTGPLALSLTSLTLENYIVGSHIDYRPVPDADFTAAFSAMTRLRRLALRTIYGIDLLLPHVAAAVSLNQLCIQPAVDKTRTKAVVAMLTQLSDLLSRCPSLRLQVEVQPARPTIPNTKATGFAAALTDPAVLGPFAHRITITDVAH